MASSNQRRGGLLGAASGAAQGAALGGPVGAVIGGLAGGLSGFLGGSAADEAEELAEMQARYTELESAENRRRMNYAMYQRMGTARARVGASNLQMSGSPRRYMAQLETQGRRDLAWERFRSREEARMYREGGRLESEGIMRSMYGDALSSLGGAVASAWNPGWFEGPRDFYSADYVPLPPRALE